MNVNVNRIMTWIGRRKINVHSICANRIDYRNNHNIINDNGLIGLSYYCNSLQSLELCHRDNITDNGIIILVS